MNPWDNTTAWKNEKDFLNWLRSQTRRVWSRHPVKLSYKQQRRFKAPIGINNKEVWACHCEMCNELVRSSDCQIDHITAGGSFNDWESYTEWSKRILWVTFDDLRELCVSCHEIINLQQKSGLSFEDARLEKSVISWLKEHTVDEQKDILTKAGFTDAQVKNDKARRNSIRELLKTT